MTGRNSGIRSIGEMTQSAANATASLARRGTRGSRRNLRAVVTHAGSTLARSFIDPGGSRRANSTSTAQELTRIAAPISASRTRPIGVSGLEVPDGFEEALGVVGGERDRPCRDDGEADETP